MHTEERVVLSRDCDTHRIPSGEKMLLPKGSGVLIMQSLGGAYTVITDTGYMVRIAGNDVEAIGKIPASPAPAANAAGEPPDLPTQVWNQLKGIYDPEIPVNIVELGLVYKCEVTPAPAPLAGHVVDVVMTLTAPGCGMGDVLRADAENRIRSLPGVTDVNVQVVVEPPWNQTMMSEGAKLQLGLL